jgi:hypothetical protein
VHTLRALLVKERQGRIKAERTLRERVQVCNDSVTTV